MENSSRFITANKRVLTGLLLVFLVALMGYFMSGSNEDSANNVYSLNTADSVISVLEKMNQEKYLKVGVDKLDLFQSAHPIEYKKLMGYITNRVDREEDAFGHSLLFVIHGFECHQKGELDSVQSYLEEAESVLPVGSDKSYYYYLKSIYMMDKRQYRAAKELIHKGLVEANKFGDIHVKSRLLNQLATIYFNQSLYGAAAKCFTEVYENYPKYEPMSATLVNQIISLKLAEKNYQGADEFWKKNQSLVEGARDPNSDCLLGINKLQVNIHLGRWDQSAAIFSSMPDSTVLPNFRVDFLRCKLMQQKQVDESKVVSVIKSHMPWIVENYYQSMTSINEFLENSISENPDLFDLDSLSLMHDRSKQQFDENPEANSHHYRFVAKILKAKGDPDKAYIALKQSMDFGIEHLNFRDSITKADFTAKKELEGLRSTQLAYEMELSSRKKISNYTYGLYLLGIVILFLVALFLYMQHRIKRRELAWANIELSKQREEKEHMQKEKEMNERLINMSELVISKSLEISKKLKSIKTENPSELDSIRRDLEAMSRLENAARPQLADSKIKEQGDIFNHYPALKTLSLTEKRIFILSVDGYKSKDIAAIVGVTPQYIHNVRSKIRRILGIDNSIHWESFKEKS